MIQKPFDSITKQDIEFLVANRVPESKDMEYKKELPGTNDEAKKEFLADVSSFANASGGDIIYGISEAIDDNRKKTGEPENVCPITGATADEVKRRLDDMIRQGIAPRFQYQIREITSWEDDGNGFIILIRILKSFSSPHMVIFGGASRFYSRSSAGKHQLDIQEIRSAFLATESQAERIKRFREDRIAKILADETPVPLSSPHRLVLHVIPVPSFMNRDRIDFSESNLSLSTLFPILFPTFGGGGDSHRFNLDGSLLYYRQGDTSTCFSYRQLFYDGTVEIVDSEFVDKKDNGVGVKNASDVTISSLSLENRPRPRSHK
ncbi:MAG: ATP-binding protein [Planctomycetota bacterium]